MCNDFCLIIEQYTVRAIVKFVPQTILWWKIYKLNNKFCLRLLWTLISEQFRSEKGCTCRLDFCQFWCTLWLLISFILLSLKINLMTFYLFNFVWDSYLELLNLFFRGTSRLKIIFFCFLAYLKFISIINVLNEFKLTIHGHAMLLVKLFALSLRRCLSHILMSSMRCLSYCCQITADMDPWRITSCFHKSRFHNFFFS